MSNQLSNGAIQAKISKGWKPNLYLTNISQAFFQNPADYVATKIFPIVPVSQSTGYFYTFSKEDLARDNVQRKPAFGKVQPAIMGHTDDAYHCEVDQIIVGVDQIGSLDYTRAGAPGAIDPRRGKVRFATEQLLLHLDLLFAQHFFKSGVWSQEYTGVASTPSATQFLKFSDGNFDPVNFFNNKKKEIKREGRRTPNKLALGIEAFNALINHGDIVERVKYSGSTANPAIVNERVLAELFGLSEVVVLDSTYNAAGIGQENMQFICDPKAALLCYTTNAPAIDEPSAGYIFTWDMLGNGSFTAYDQYEGENGTHSEFIEGLMSTDMKKTSDCLAMYFKDCV